MKDNRRGGPIRLRQVISFRSETTDEHQVTDFRFSTHCSEGPQWGISQQGPGRVLELKVPGTTEGRDSRMKPKQDNCFKVYSKVLKPLGSLPCFPQRWLLLCKLKQKAARFKLHYTNNSTLHKNRRSKCKVSTHQKVKNSVSTGT